MNVYTTIAVNLLLQSNPLTDTQRTSLMNAIEHLASSLECDYSRALKCIMVIVKLRKQEASSCN